jgi:hypothetical protein
MQWTFGNRPPSLRIFLPAALHCLFAQDVTIQEPGLNLCNPANPGPAKLKISCKGRVQAIVFFFEKKNQSADRLKRLLDKAIAVRTKGSCAVAASSCCKSAILLMLMLMVSLAVVAIEGTVSISLAAALRKACTHALSSDAFPLRKRRPEWTKQQ